MDSFCHVKGTISGEETKRDLLEVVSGGNQFYFRIEWESRDLGELRGVWGEIIRANTWVKRVMVKEAPEVAAIISKRGKILTEDDIGNLSEMRRALESKRLELENKLCGEKLTGILAQLLGTANLTTGAVAQAGYGHCSIQLTSVVTERNIRRVFKRFGIEQPLESAAAVDFNSSRA
jgi:hypothetical protein